MGTHLIVIVHDIYANSDTVALLTDSIQSEFNVTGTPISTSSMSSHHNVTDVHIYVSSANEDFATCNSSWLLGQCSAANTMREGIAPAGIRLAKELDDVIRIYDASYVSFVAVGIGGLVARYAIGAMFKSGRIQDLVPLYFITIGTPHLGLWSTEWSTVKTFCLDTWNSYIRNCWCACFSFSQTMHECLLNDGKFGVPCLLLEMSRDGVLPFMSALKSFRMRVAYANICNDWLASYATAAITASKFVSQHIRSSVIVADTAVADSRYLHDKSMDLIHHHHKEHLIRTILRNLNSLTWRRVFVRLDDLTTSCTQDAHTQIAMAKHAWGSAGLEVLLHVVSVLKAGN
jgi:hypothetical protein